jgi:hypothetical protein
MKTDQRQALFLLPNETVVYGMRRRVCCSISTSLIEEHFISLRSKFVLEDGGRRFL